MCSCQVAPPLSLFEGVDRLATDYFGITSIGHWSAMLKLGKAPPAAFDGPAFVSKLFSQVSANWNGCLAALAALDHLPSRENWRWFDPKYECSDHNRSAEVTLERNIVKAARSQNRMDWSNQVPVASGVIKGGDRKRAIDLVHQRGPSAFDFVELKVESNNPLYAAVEILQYGFVWLLSRLSQDALGYGGRPLIQASDVQLSVLAPQAYYRDLNLRWLSVGLSEGLQTLGERNGGVRLSFAFEAFAHSFAWPVPRPDPATVLSALDGRIRR